MSAKVNSNSGGIKSPGRRAMRALLKSKRTVVIPTYATRQEVTNLNDGRVLCMDGHATGKPHKDGNRATRRAALKTARTKQRQASREYQGLAPVEIAIVKRRKAVRAPKVSQ